MPSVPAGSSVSERPAAGRGSDALALLLLILTATAFGLVATTRRADLTSGDWFLFADQGMNLLFTQRLLAGASLFRDVAYPYGPISAYAYAAVAAAIGPSVFSYHLYFLLTSLVALAAAYALFRGTLRPAAAAALGAVAMIPTMMAPGSLLGATSNSPYIPLERILLLLLALVWTPVASRTSPRAAWLGAILAVWQGTKFGGAVVAGAAIVVVDLLSLHMSGWSRQAIERWLRVSLITLAMFVAGEALWAVYAFATLPRSLALEVLWPIHLLDVYSMYPAAARGLHFNDVRLVVGQYLTPILGAGLATAFAARLMIGRNTALPDANWRWVRFVIPPAFFAIGSFGYFRQTWHFEQTMWALAIAAGLSFAIVAPWPRRAALMLLLPCFALCTKAIFLNRRNAALVEHRLPNGDRLMISPEVQRRAQGIVATLGAEASANGRPRRAVLVVPSGGGMNFFYALPTPVRQSWYIPGFVRPRDEQQMRDVLADGSATFVVFRYGRGDPNAADPCAWVSPSAFSRSFCTELAPRLALVRRVDDDVAVFNVRPPSSPTSVP